MRLNFNAPTFLHPNKDENGEEITVYEVAKKLESKYNLLGGFVAHYKTELEDIISQEAIKRIQGRKTQEQFKKSVDIRIQALWRDYMKSETHGIKTRIATEEDRKAFIDTGTYFMSIEPELVVDNG